MASFCANPWVYSLIPYGTSLFLEPPPKPWLFRTGLAPPAPRTWWRGCTWRSSGRRRSWAHCALYLPPLRGLCSPAESFTFSGLMENPFVGKPLQSPNIQATCTKDKQARIQTWDPNGKNEKGNREPGWNYPRLWNPWNSWL